MVTNNPQTKPAYISSEEYPIMVLSVKALYITDNSVSK